MPAPTEWQSADHPTVPGFYCLRRFPHAHRIEYFGNRMSAEPPIEAFLTQEQALRVAEYVKSRRGAVDNDRDLDL
ncbi:hypothetical protein [Variovorax sp. J22R115]|uniref:hypothetical protein n=1 Tax=Variovorax sp. J22R115 TaxID=3053509 RepID=UPI0025758034|nr:hypothetical protein [Variovorax sp. J22R115]MDM0050927.1 hypothetical protein [Variovorax sp. J22R115]